MTPAKSRATRGSISPRGGRAPRKPDDRRTLEQRATFQREGLPDLRRKRTPQRTLPGVDIAPGRSEAEKVLA
jgi:hypothetical protein